MNKELIFFFFARITSMCIWRFIVLLLRIYNMCFERDKKKKQEEDFFNFGYSV